MVEFMALLFSPDTPLGVLGLFALFMAVFLTGFLLGMLLSPSELRVKVHYLEDELRQLKKKQDKIYGT